MSETDVTEIWSVVIPVGTIEDVVVIGGELMKIDEDEKSSDGLDEVTELVNIAAVEDSCCVEDIGELDMVERFREASSEKSEVVVRFGVVETGVVARSRVVETGIAVKSGVTETRVVARSRVVETGIVVKSGVIETGTAVKSGVIETGLVVRSGVIETGLVVRSGVVGSEVVAKSGVVESEAVSRFGVVETAMVDDTTAWIAEELDGVTEGDTTPIDEVIIVVVSEAILDDVEVTATGVELATSATADEVREGVVEGWGGGKLAMNIVVSAKGSFSG